MTDKLTIAKQADALIMEVSVALRNIEIVLPRYAIKAALEALGVSLADLEGLRTDQMRIVRKTGMSSDRKFAYFIKDDGEMVIEHKIEHLTKGV